MIEILEPSNAEQAEWPDTTRKYVEALRAALDAAEGERDEYKQLFGIQWDADRRAVEEWRAANPGNDLVFPDSTRLAVWALEQRDKALAERDQWIAHAKAAIWTDSEECKALTEACERLAVERDDAMALVAECAEYLKDGETPRQRMDRDHKDVLALMELLVAEKNKVRELKAAEARCISAVEAVDVEAAVQAEREACAQTVEALPNWDEHGRYLGLGCRVAAAAIRARRG